MGKNKDNEGAQQAAQHHAHGQQGEKTRSRQAEIANAGRDDTSNGPRHDEAEISAHDTTGRDRLFEGRQQHDEAEKNSEKTRLARDLDRHNHTPEDELSHTSRQASAKRKS